MLVPMRSSSVAMSSFCRATLAGRRERCQGYSVSMTVSLAIAGVTGRMRLWTVMGEGWAALELDRDRAIVYTLLVSDAVPGACCEAPFFLSLYHVPCVSSITSFSCAATSPRTPGLPVATACTLLPDAPQCRRRVPDDAHR